jgi:tRNA modification GTPase
VSGKTGDGVPKLLELISSRFKNRTVEDFVAIRQRQIDGLQAALASLKETLLLLARRPVPFELAAQELYFASSSLDFVFGKVDIESVLDEIFSTFCLGK